MAYEITWGDRIHRAEARREGDGWVVEIDGESIVVDVREHEPGVLAIVRDGDVRTARTTPTATGFDVDLRGARYALSVVDERRKALAAITGEGGAGRGEVISTSMPGKVVAILVAEGDAVDKGDGVIVIEAMKMENELKASGPGVISSIPVAVGDAVEAGAELVRIAPLEDSE